MKNAILATIALLMGISFSCGDEAQPISKAKDKAPFYLRPVFLKFEEMATKEVVDKALQKAGKLKVSDPSVYDLDLQGISSTLRWTVREVASGNDTKIYARVYAACMECEYHAKRDKVAHQPELWHWRQGLLAIARNYLRDPKRLKAIYHTFRPAIRSFVNKHPQKAKVKKYIHEVLLPAFTGKVDSNLPKKIAKLHALRAIWKGQKERSEAMQRFCPWSSASSKDGPGNKSYYIPDKSHCNNVAFQQMKEADVESDKASDPVFELWDELANLPSLYEYEWMLRRFREGGSKLVKAWAEIFTDIGAT